MMRFRTIAWAAALSAAVQIPLRAQCAMCRSAASAQSAHASHMLNTAILILLLPALMLFCGVFLMAFRMAAPTSRDGEGEDLSDER